VARLVHAGHLDPGRDAQQAQLVEHQEQQRHGEAHPRGHATMTTMCAPSSRPPPPPMNSPQDDAQHVAPAVQLRGLERVIEFEPRRQRIEPDEHPR
jgi:hypothetical protein